MSAPLPTVVFIHGAWHQPQHYESLISALQSKGLTVEAPKLPSAGSGCELKEDVDTVNRVVGGLVDSGKEVIVVAHSYGGIPATAGIDKSWLGAGKGEAGVKGLVYITCFAAPAKEMSLKDIIGGTFPDWFEARGDQFHPKPSALDVFYNGVAPEKIAVAKKLLSSQSVPSFTTPVGQVASDLEGLDKVYVTCEDDKAIPIPGQMAMAQAAGARIVSLPCGHSPFLMDGHMVELVGVVEEVVRK